MREHVHGILRELCRSTGLLYAMSIIEGILLAFSIVGLLVLDPGTGSYVVSLLNVGGLTVLFTFTTSVVVYCFRY